ncbi:MAG: mycothiol system anti-sigma-R factor [Acidimicrobiia bacterium]|nr:mycothiol system anti-sigma-R factor [Acidimicrobiia bacterium]
MLEHPDATRRPGHDHGPDGHTHNSVGCQDALAELYLYLDGELTTDRLSSLRAHLEDCSPCFEAFDFEAELRMVVASRCRDTVPEELRQRILQSLRDGACGTADTADA